MIRTCLALLVAPAIFAGTILLPGGNLTVPGTAPGGASFVFAGTLTQADTLDFIVSGAPCLQSGNTYCTNAAGVIVTAGSSGVGATTTFGGTFAGTTATWNYGSLLLLINGVGAVQIFPANATNGLGSATPPSLLTLPTTSLSSLGFSAFSVNNPTLTFQVADTNFSDNSSAFGLRQAGGTVPEPSTMLLAGAGLVAAALLRRRRV